jgi:hypothetical protein
MQYLAAEDSNTLKKVGFNVVALLGVTVALLVITMLLA